MPLPTLATLEQDATRAKRLQEENDSLRHKIAALMELPNAATIISALNNSTGITGSNPVPSGTGLVIQDVVPPEVPQPADLMDDFYIIAP